MVIAIMGESCVGKSTLADRLRKRMDTEIFTGKDYVRLASSEGIAAKLFARKLQQALTDGDIIYVISEKEQLKLVPEGAVRVLMTAELPVIEQRFTLRMNGALPEPIRLMLKRKHGMFDAEPCDLRIDGCDDPDRACEKVLAMAQR